MDAKKKKTLLTFSYINQINFKLKTQKTINLLLNFFRKRIRLIFKLFIFKKYFCFLQWINFLSIAVTPYTSLTSCLRTILKIKNKFPFFITFNFLFGEFSVKILMKFISSALLWLPLGEDWSLVEEKLICYTKGMSIYARNIWFGSILI